MLNGSVGVTDGNATLPNWVKLEPVAAMIRPRKHVEIWFQDEARIGQKNTITRPQARR